MRGRILFTPEERIGLRLSLDPRYQDASDTELYEVVESSLDGLTYEEKKNFWDKALDVGKVVGGVALKAAPAMASGALTGAAGGPVGAVAGALIGGAGSLLSGSQPSKTPAPAPQVPPAPRARVRRPAGAKRRRKISPSAQLLYLLDSPRIRQALLSIALGAPGARMIPVSGVQVPTTDLIRPLEVLAASAAKEAAEEYATDEEEEESQPWSANNDFDPAIPEHRANAVMDLLQREEQLFETVETDDEEDEDLDNMEESVITLDLR